MERGATASLMTGEPVARAGFDGGCFNTDYLTSTATRAERQHLLRSTKRFVSTRIEPTKRCVQNAMIIYARHASWSVCQQRLDYAPLEVCHIGSGRAESESGVTRKRQVGSISAGSRLMPLGELVTKSGISVNLAERLDRLKGDGASRSAWSGICGRIDQR
jgi:hypothetical protein